jgi:hypothetical protein
MTVLVCMSCRPCSDDVPCRWAAACGWSCGAVQGAGDCCALTTCVVRGVCLAVMRTPSTVHPVTARSLTKALCAGAQDALATTQRLEDDLCGAASSLVGQLEQWRQRSAAARAAAIGIRQLDAARLNRRVAAPRLH